MTADRRNAVRRMSRNDAEQEALLLATPVIQAAENDEWALRVRGAIPDRDKPCLVGKTPSRWKIIVQGQPRNEPNAVVDGGDGFLIVDLVEGSVKWE